MSLPDVSEFLRKFKLPSNPITVQTSHGLPTQPCYGGISCDEANLDVEYIVAMAPHAKTTYWYIDSDNPSFEPFVMFLTQLLELAKPPMVSSISYGITEQVTI